jgi:uncharacterized SAM-binding protein YcdF (DUF218 family)
LDIEFESTMQRLKLFRQRQIWMPTILGWLFLLLLFIALSILLLKNLYTFLAPNDPVGARVLVVEGWLSPDELVQAIQAYKNGKYERIVTTGGPVTGWPGSNLDTDYAKLAADYLAHHGIRPDLIYVVSAPQSAQERTFLSAVMFRESAQRLGITLDAVDIFSSGPHARRSRLLFQMALGQEVRVGILAARPSDFEPESWWRTSVGVEKMLFQSFGFAWVKCCFWPGPPGSKEELWD